MSSKEGRSFRNLVLKHWKQHGRHRLPWRKTKDPYKILVSEVMLQQTQVDRVVPYYRRFLARFPTVQDLAKAELSEVLKHWSGLGYNRRAKYLQGAAKAVVELHGGRFPKTYEALRKLPGVGDYTARAVRVFAFNEPDVLIETNIRTVFFHSYHSSILQNARTSDKELSMIAAEAAAGQDPREWHWALMDYGAYLKKSGIKLNKKSAHYAKQSKFEGSLRQVRGAILKAHLDKQELRSVKKRFGKKFDIAFTALKKEGLIS